MDHLQRTSYEKDFRIAFLESKGDGFQRLFEKLMFKVHPNDFLACRPWGNVGDKKNDGYLPSARTIYQIYAPNELTANDAIKKINEDFNGAKEHWECTGQAAQDTFIWEFSYSNGLIPLLAVWGRLKL